MVNPSKGIKLIDVSGFLKKTDMKGNVRTYKVRLVTKNYKQRQNIDFD